MGDKEDKRTAFQIAHMVKQKYCDFCPVSDGCELSFYRMMCNAGIGFTSGTGGLIMINRNWKPKHKMTPILRRRRSGCRTKNPPASAVGSVNANKIVHDRRHGNEQL